MRSCSHLVVDECSESCCFNDLTVDYNRTKLARQEQLERSRKSITARVGSWVVDAMQSSYVRAVYVPLECTSPTYRSLGLYKNNNNDKG